MALMKKVLKSRPVCKVRFKVSAEEAQGSEVIFLVGSFNGWNEKDMPMNRNKDGSFTLEIDLPSGEKHHFRYLRSDGVWMNDSQADAYEPCEFGVDNSVVHA
jgi:1,4-alpha-glucan branching enzyme